MTTNVDPTRIDIATDPTQRRMKGIARHGYTPFDVPFISEVGDNLWQGGCADGMALPDFIVNVVSLYPWERYALHENVRGEHYIEMYNSEEQAFDQVDEIAQMVNICRADGPTLVHCQAGLNQSSLIAARALYLDAGPKFNDGDQIVEHLRAARSPACLCNPAFEAEVRSWCR